MYILGISAFYHDSAAALLKDGQLVAASMEERFSRRKHDNRMPIQAIVFCLKQAGITAADLDYVVFYEKPLQKFERILQTALNTFPNSGGVWQEAIIKWMGDKLWIKGKIVNALGIDPKKLLFCDHHMSHAASAFFASPYKDAAVLTCDGVGEWTSTTLGTATSYWNGETGANDINLFSEQRFPHSLGLLYSTFTAWLGFRVNNGEYKVMGMSPYGTPRYMEKMERVFHLNPSDGSFRLNMDYFSFATSADSSFSSKFVDLWGEPRPEESDFFTLETNPERAGEKAALALNQHYADVSATIQRATEDTLIAICNHLHEVTGKDTLVMAGGVALNTKANWRLLTETPFKEIYIQPASGDDGGALGAALWAWHVVLNKPREWVMPHAYWGKSYTEAEIKQTLDDNGIAYESFESDPDKLLDVVAEELTKSKVVGWMQGRFEWGPRALGARSILADPRTDAMKEVVNTKIKFREPFRPFAPVVLRDRALEYFDYPEVQEHEAPRYMLMVAPVRQEKQDSIQAVVHKGTGRLQSIERETNPRYYGVIERFDQLTGVPVVLNTSFNLRGEPIVNTPANALNTFVNSDIDLLVMETLLVRKSGKS
jgi:carbamoyltransferase